MNFNTIKKYIIIFQIFINLNIYSKTEFNNINSKSYILVEHNSGKILLQKNANIKLAPASLTKIMTSYILGKLIKKKLININNKIKIKEEIYDKNNPKFKNSSLMFLKIGNSVKIKDLNKGIIIQSGNDACIIIAKHIIYNENNFISLMNKYAKKMNLKNTIFETVHGLDSDNQYTTAKDMSILSRFLIKNLPTEYKLYKEKEFTFNKIKQKNRNKLLWQKNIHIDGIKTGHTDGAGYNLITSATKKKTRLILVTLGAKSTFDREQDSKTILKWGLNNFKTKKIIKKKQIIKYEKIWFGHTDKIPIGTLQDIYITYPKKKTFKFIKINYKYIHKKILAPIKKYQIIGKLYLLTKNKKIIKNYPLISLIEIKKINLIKSFIKFIKTKLLFFYNKKSS